jgi:hypothetical protein
MDHFEQLEPGDVVKHQQPQFFGDPNFFVDQRLLEK